LSHLYIKTNILPRQARDKHRENSKKGPFFLRTSVMWLNFHNRDFTKDKLRFTAGFSIVVLPRHAVVDQAEADVVVSTNDEDGTFTHIYCESIA
jgi:hypothetical protein